MAKKENLEHIEQSSEAANEKNNQRLELGEVLIQGKQEIESLNSSDFHKDGTEFEKIGDIGTELLWTEYSSGWYEPRVYMGDEHGTPAHEHSDERWYTNKLLVKFGKPGDCINFFWRGSRYSVNIKDNGKVDINIHTNHRWNNNQNWRYEEMNNSNIQPGQIYINGKDMYADTVQRIKTKEQERKENLKGKFNELQKTLINTYSFSESEFKDLCKYAGKGNVTKFLSTVKSTIEKSDTKKDEIMSAMTEIKYPGDMVFRNYVLIKGKAKSFNQHDVKRVLEKGYARAYLCDNLPGIGFVGYFDDAMVALKLAFENGLFRKDNFAYSTVSEPTISDLGQALMDAGVVLNK